MITRVYLVRHGATAAAAEDYGSQTKAESRCGDGALRRANPR